ncbi:capsule biosynthesis protein CapA [Roseicyclus sp. F158]|uniref:Capsule biosynthesis protein CapA n=1 Tax=Tropicimonas omnivorans TaxID=3075590 RepID=A0ABU3DGN1_9RHOB|nr:capsule biosynthesis protein CapA [Roseicyclus sp. F158]MDT0682845.1 capsule biosynthesis protein CapA [Roseicyclus sp. F158]
MSTMTFDSFPPAPQRRFLFLQGPHGPFFHHLGRMLRAAGAEVWRVAFNAGDDAFWFHRRSLIPFRETAEEWPAFFSMLLHDKGITDIVLYGDTRAIHARAVEIARDRGVTVHVFEEGYLRPYWVTYERGGANGHSRLMRLSVPDMRRALDQSELEQLPAPARWGDMRHHVFYGALYHGVLLMRTGRYANFRPHRTLTASQEFRLYLRRLMLMPFHWMDRIVATGRIRGGGFPYHLALLQLEHDASFQQHSPFSSMTEFLALLIEGFASGAPKHHHLVFKAHPLEDGRKPLRTEIRRLAREHGVSGRVHYVRGGKLAGLLDHARSAVTVNSTAAQQVLWRGLPLKVFGKAVYAKSEFVSDQPLPAFFARPARPDARAYRDFRTFLLETSQIAGGFYSAAARRQLLRQVVDMMLAADDPYDALASGNAHPRQHLQIVR